MLRLVHLLQGPRAWTLAGFEDNGESSTLQQEISPWFGIVVCFPNQMTKGGDPQYPRSHMISPSPRWLGTSPKPTEPTEPSGKGRAERLDLSHVHDRHLGKVSSHKAVGWGTTGYKN